MKYSVKTDKTHTVEIDRKTTLTDSFDASIDGTSHAVQIKEYYPNGRIKTLMVDHQVIPVEIVKHADGFPKTVYLNGLPFEVEIEKVKSLQNTAIPPDKKISGDVNANLPGQVLSIEIAEGDSVEQGQSLLILESMKMENIITSPKSGRVKSIAVKTGQVVMKGDLLMQIDEQ